MAEPIYIRNVPQLYRNSFTIADMTPEIGGNQNGCIDTQAEAEAAVDVCQENCRNLKIYLKYHQFQITLDKDFVSFEERLEQAKTIEDPPHKAAAHKDIALELAEIGLFEKALDIARIIEDPEIFCHIASKMLVAGVEEKEAVKAFKEALTNAVTIISHRKGDARFDYSIILPVIYEISKSGLNKTNKEVLFREALPIVRTIEEAGTRAIVLYEIGLEMLKAEIDKKSVKKVFEEVLQNILKTEYLSFLNIVLNIEVVPFEMARAGLDKSQLRPWFKKALTKAKYYLESTGVTDISDPEADTVVDHIRYGVLPSIKKGMKNAGFTNEEIKALFREVGVEMWP